VWQFVSKTAIGKKISIGCRLAINAFSKVLYVYSSCVCPNTCSTEILINDRALLMAFSLGDKNALP
jgi:hypothetical protein